MLDGIEELPLLERIHMHKHEHHERDRVYRKRIGKCTRKMDYSRKTAKGQRSTLLKNGNAPYLRVYKCTKSGYWHLTHLKPRHG